MDARFGCRKHGPRICPASINDFLRWILTLLLCFTLLLSLLTSDVQAITAASIVSPTPGTRLESSSVTFHWNNDDYSHQLWVSTDGYDIFRGDWLRPGITSVTVGNLPTDGRTLYVRLETCNMRYFGCVERAYKNYTYTAVDMRCSGAETITLPYSQYLTSLSGKGDSVSFRINLDAPGRFTAHTRAARGEEIGVIGELKDCNCDESLAKDSNSGEGDHFVIDKQLFPGCYHLLVARETSNGFGSRTVLNVVFWPEIPKNDESDILDFIPAILAASKSRIEKEIDDPLERSLTATYVLHPADSEIFTTLQLVVLAKMYMDLTSPRHADLSQSGPFDPNVIGRAKANAQRILNSSDPIRKANALLQLGMPVSTVSFLRPYARTPLNREETISGLDRVFMESVREAISATNSQSQSLSSKLATSTTSQDPQNGWVSLGGNGPVRGNGGTAADPYDGGYFYRGVKHFRTFMDDFYEDCFNELARIALENALKDMSLVYRSAAPGAVDFLVSIGENIKATLTAYSVVDRVEQVWNHFQSLADFSGNVGEQLGKAMVKGAKDLAEIQFDGDSIPPVPAEVYRKYSYNNVPLDSLLNNTDYSQWESKHWNIEPPVVSHSPNPFYQIGPPGTGTDSVSRVTRIIPPGDPQPVELFAPYNSEDPSTTISRCLINGEVVSSWKGGDFAYYFSLYNTGRRLYPAGTQLTLEIVGGVLGCCAHITTWSDEHGWIYLYRNYCPECLIPDDRY